MSTDVGYLYLIVLSTKFPRGWSVLCFHSWLVSVLLSISFQLLLETGLSFHSVCTHFQPCVWFPDCPILSWQKDYEKATLILSAQFDRSEDHTFYNCIKHPAATAFKNILALALKKLFMAVWHAHKTQWVYSAYSRGLSMHHIIFRLQSDHRFMFCCINNSCSIQKPAWQLDPNQCFLLELRDCVNCVCLCRQQRPNSLKK